MHEILRNLAPGSRVLDVGSLNGSFRADCCPDCVVVKMDLEIPAPESADGFVQGDAAFMPFADHCFDAVIASHSLEHIQDLAQALREVGRVVMSSGSFFVAVPDSSTFSDRLFRWIYQEASGHINPFTSADALAAEITRVTGLTLAAVRPLNSSFEYLNRYYFGRRSPWRLWLVGNGNRRSILALSYAARLFDRLFHRRSSVYGWAFYFGDTRESVDTAAWSNVCVGCGSGFPSTWLLGKNLVSTHLFVLRSYRCPVCNSGNLFTLDY